MTALQKNAELVFNKPRQQNDPTKLDEFVSAQIELNCAAKVFKQLQQVSGLSYHHQHAGWQKAAWLHVWQFIFLQPFPCMAA